MRPGARRPARRRSAWLLAALLALAATGALLGYRLAADYEVLEKGQLLPYSAGTVYKVRLGGWLTLYVEPELRPSFDLLNAYLLTGVAFISLTFGVIVAKLHRDTGSSRFWFFVTAFFGASYLVADEALGIHETLGHNLPFLARLPLVERPDDAVVVLLAVPAALFLVVFRPVLMASRRAAILYGVGLVGFLAAAAADLLSLPLEELAEVLATLCLAAGTLFLGLHLTRPDPAAGPPRSDR